MNIFSGRALRIIFCLSILSSLQIIQRFAQGLSPAKTEKIIVDTDIGDDIDDAFALALALRSPELQIMQINTTFGNTALRSQLLDRFLSAIDRSDIAISTGAQTSVVNNFSQQRYAEGSVKLTAPRPDAVTSTLENIRKYPGEITLIAIGPLFNIGAMIDKDPETFHKLKRVVVMGGSIHQGHSDGYSALGAEPEWNIRQDVSGAQKLIAAGVPVDMMPLDATNTLKLDEVKRAALFKRGTPLTDQLLILYEQWGLLTPTLYDALAVGYAINSNLCTAEPMDILIDTKGYTRVQSGKPNVDVCLHMDPQKFFDFFMPRLLTP
jgi:inosine-uridine nucleoside N-ribohydrolase